MDKSGNIDAINNEAIGLYQCHLRAMDRWSLVQFISIDSLLLSVFSEKLMLYSNREQMYIHDLLFTLHAYVTR